MNEPLRIADLAEIAAHPERLRWEPLRPGVEMHRLYQIGSDGPSAAFLRYAAGTRLDRHRHAGFEHIFVLAGSQEDERGRYGAGAMVVNPPGSAHNVSSSEGCIVLVLWERPVIFERAETSESV
jgi:anti-sigma factor ChrR (cupin superfamily)